MIRRPGDDFPRVGRNGNDWAAYPGGNKPLPAKFASAKVIEEPPSFGEAIPHLQGYLSFTVSIPVR